LPPAISADNSSYRLRLAEADFRKATGRQRALGGYDLLKWVGVLRTVPIHVICDIRTSDG
jgi:hypothetical protein